MKRAKDEVEGMKAALWDSSVKLTRADDRTSPQSQTVSCKLLVNYGACPVHRTECVCSKHACAHTVGLCVCVCEGKTVFLIMAYESAVPS